MKKQKQVKVVRLSTVRASAQRMGNTQIVNLCRIAQNARNLANCNSVGEAVSALHYLRAALRSFG